MSAVLVMGSAGRVLVRYSYAGGSFVVRYGSERAARAAMAVTR